MTEKIFETFEFGIACAITYVSQIRPSMKGGYNKRGLKQVIFVFDKAQISNCELIKAQYLDKQLQVDAYKLIEITRIMKGDIKDVLVAMDK